MFEFLKIVVPGKRAKPAPKAPQRAQICAVDIDGKRFPIAAITDKGFVATGFDGSLIAGQNARITVVIDDAYAKLQFATTVLVTEAKGERLVTAWNLITPELTETLRKYSQRRKQATVQKS